MKISVLPPDINCSEAAFSIENHQAIRFSLGAIKGVGQAAIETIIEARKKSPFISFRDFLERVDLRKVNKKTVEELIKAGAMDQFGNRAQLLVYYGQIIKKITQEKISAQEGQFGLFNNEENNKKVNADQLPEVAEFVEETILEYEREAIGFNLSKNPLEKYQIVLQQKRAIPINELSAGSKTDLLIGGLVKATKKILTKKDNSEMVFATLTDYTGEIEVVVFPKVFIKTKDLWQRNQPLLLRGRVQDKDNALVFIVSEAVSLRHYD
jgi:DNA polymerase-3 subunit alpha